MRKPELLPVPVGDVRVYFGHGISASVSVHAESEASAKRGHMAKPRATIKTNTLPSSRSPVRDAMTATYRLFFLSQETDRSSVTP